MLLPRENWIWDGPSLIYKPIRRALFDQAKGVSGTVFSFQQDSSKCFLWCQFHLQYLICREKGSTSVLKQLSLAVHVRVLWKRKWILVSNCGQRTGRLSGRAYTWAWHGLCAPTQLDFSCFSTQQMWITGWWPLSPSSIPLSLALSTFASTSPSTCTTHQRWAHCCELHKKIQPALREGGRWLKVCSPDD